MNHISKSFTSTEGHTCKSHSWEQREGGYRRVALLVGNGLWPVQKETRLIDFLLERGFRVLALEIAYGSPEPPRLRLRSFISALADFAKVHVSAGLPLYLFASSFSATALIPAAVKMQDLAALALLSPVLRFPVPGLILPPCFLSTTELSVDRAALSGMPELLEGFLEGTASLKFHKRDLKTAAAEISKALAEGFSVPVAVFAGEDDPCLPEAGRQALSKAGARVHSYPRAKREPGHDRCADAYFADLASFLDTVDAGRASRKEPIMDSPVS
jgi:alpha-beta hydrolase superfamily lysophospholipase